MNNIDKGFIDAVLNNDIDSVTMMKNYVKLPVIRIAMRKYKMKYKIHNDKYKSMIDLLNFAITDFSFAELDRNR